MSANDLGTELLIEIPKRYRHLVVWRNNRIKTMAVGDGGRQRMVDAGIDGQGDYSGIVGPSGRRVEIETKWGRDRLRQSQKEFKQMILAHGGVYVEWRGLESGIAELERQLKEAEREKREQHSIPVVRIRN
jgi:hypothetical protein